MSIEIYKDDRTCGQRETHTVIIAGRDRFLSSWGPGESHGGSTAAWACEPHHAKAVDQWVRSRGDMTHVRKTTVSALRRVRGLVHIYVVGDIHPAMDD